MKPALARNRDKLLQCALRLQVAFVSNPCYAGFSSFA